MSGVYAVELTPYDTDAAAEVTLRYATKGFTTTPGDTPSNAFYDARVKQPALLRRNLWGNGRIGGRRRVSVGELVLLNGDGTLDGILDHSWDGRGITVYYGDSYAGNFTSDFTEVFTGTIARHPDHDLTEIRFAVHDRQSLVDVPLQETLYAGDNSLPAGLEGVSDLKGKPKPILYGDVLNISPPEVNTVKLIFQLNDGALDSVEEVYDRGIKLGRTFAGWDNRTTSVAVDLNDVVASDDVVIAVGNTGTIIRSTDGGATWAAASTPSFGTSNIRCIAHNTDDDVFVAAGADGKIGYSTDDGDTWTQATSPFGAPDTVEGAAYGQAKFVVVTDTGDSSQGSANGQTWESAVTVDAGGLQDVAFGRDRFVAVQGSAWYSTDQGASWTEGSTALSTLKGTVTWDGQQFLAGQGYNDTTGAIESSPDAISWTIRYTGDFRVFGLTFGGPFRALIAVGGINSQTTSSILSSTDQGTTWIRRTTTTGADFGLAASGNEDEMIVVGQSGETETASPAGTYASQADLLDDALQPDDGTYKAYLAGGYIRLGGPPDGRVTADAIQGDAASDRTAGQLFTDVLEQVGLTSSDWNSSDITALDTDNNAVLGYWSGTSPVQASQVLDDLAASVGAWWGVDRTGTFRIQRFEDPSGETATVSLDSTDIIKGTFRRVSETGEGRGIPVWRSVVRYAKNYTVQESDVAANAEEARKARINKEWLEESDEDTSVQTTHRLAREQIDDSLLTTSSDASSEASRRRQLLDGSHDAYQFEIPLDTTNATIDLGTIVDLTFPRFGFVNGLNVVVIGVEPDAERRRIRLTVWL